MSDIEPPDLHVVPVSESGRKPEDDDEGENSLSAQEIRFADALATGATPREAAKSVGISERTGRRWRQKVEIMAAIRARLNDAIAVGRSILASGHAQAATAIVGMAGGAVPAESSRIAACRVVIESNEKWGELAEVKAELDEIKTALATMPGGHANTFRRS
jgi:hypothetical protein